MPNHPPGGVVRLNRPMSAGLDAARDLARTLLAGLERRSRRSFELRLERWWQDLVSGLDAVYPAQDTQALGLRLVRLAACAYRERTTSCAGSTSGASSSPTGCSNRTCSDTPATQTGSQAPSPPCPATSTTSASSASPTCT